MTLVSAPVASVITAPAALDDNVVSQTTNGGAAELTTRPAEHPLTTRAVRNG
jgi:hypothetical protein